MMTAKERQELHKEMVRLGAQTHRQKLVEAIKQIDAIFPDLENDTPVKAAKKASNSSNNRNWNMSAAQRSAVSKRMKKYWASKRKAEKVTAEAQPAPKKGAK